MTDRIPEGDRPAPELAAMIDDVRKEQPVVDWSRVEAKLFAELDHAPPRSVESARQPSRRGAAYVAGALAIAAGAVFAVTRMPERARAPEIAPTVAVATNAAPSFVPVTGDDGHAFAKGARLEGGSTGLWLRAKGRIAIRVEPGASATLLDDGTRIRLSLERGAVAADVVPVPGGEPFAVDVLSGSAKRVAVHGTKLRIALVADALAADAIEVAVAEGVAVVGAPRGDDRTTGTEVPAGSFGRFVSGAAGGDSVVPLPQAVEKSVFSALLLAKDEGVPAIVSASPSSHGKAPLGKDSAAKPSTTTPLDAQKGSTPASPPPSGLSEAQLAPAFAKLDQELGVCAPSAASGATITFAATLLIKVGTDGKAQLEGAEPGLDVKVRECVRSALARVTFPTADAPTVAKKPMVLTAK